jgi:hypothetical protein
MLVSNGSATFPRISGSPQTPQTVTVNFPSAVTRATAILTGFNAEFSPQGGDHHLGQIDVRLSTGAPAGTTVPVTVFFDLRDWSGNRDDLYDGQVFFTVVAE